MTIFHHKLLTREGRVLAYEYTHDSSFMTIYVHLLIQKVIIVKCHLTLDIIFGVASPVFSNLGPTCD